MIDSEVKLAHCKRYRNLIESKDKIIPQTGGGNVDSKQSVFKANTKWKDS